uniref:VP1 capsid protein n=1 Tax=California sea lion norovirus TaxID=2070151 RepID=A0A2R2ZGA3_9CALI|nr:VP1 capsid protein [California sea lion norovirus]
MKMASNDASPKTEGAGLVPEVSNEVLPIEPVAGAALAAPVAGQNNLIDPWIMTNFVQAPEGEFTISPRNGPGEVLLDVELGPELNPYLGHLARMYNGHAGGVEAQIVLAGNAFTAGKVLIAVVPPGFPTHNMSPSQATMLPHIIVDVRCLDPVNIPIPDVRNQLFHYNREGPPRMRLMVMLYTPLRTNGGEDGNAFTVTGRLLTRPGPDFGFLFLVPPTVEQSTKPFTVPRFTVAEMTNSRFPHPIQQLYTDPMASIQVQPQNGRCTIDGELLGTTQLSALQVCTFNGKAIANPGSARTFAGNTGEEPMEGTEEGGPTLYAWNKVWMELVNPDGSAYDPIADGPAPLGCPDFQAELQSTLVNTSGGNGNLRVSIFTTQNNPQFAPGVGTIVMDADPHAAVPTAGNTVYTVPISVGAGEPFSQWKLPHYSGAFGRSSRLAPPVAPNYPGEQLLFFRSGLVNNQASQRVVFIDCLLPNEFIKHFYEQAAPVGGEIALLRYINPDTGRALFECKLHPSGFMTVAATGSTTLQITPGGYFRFDSWVSNFYTLSPVGTSSGRRARTARQ